MHSKTVLIIGSTGKTGQRIEKILNNMGIATRGVSRSTAIPFDWYESNTWNNALNGIKAAYVSFQPDLAVPGAADIMQRFVDSAKAAGLEHLVLLSGRGEDGAQHAEKIVRNSGLSWNVVRASWFAQNFSEGFMLEGILSGEMILPESNVLEPFIDVDDIAEVAAAALTRDELKNRLFEVTGPRSMTFADCIDAINTATGNNIRLLPVSVDDYINYLQAQGLPGDIQWLMRELFTVVFDGRNSAVANGVEQALGRRATDFDEYVRKTLDTGIWSLNAIAAND